MVLYDNIYQVLRKLKFESVYLNLPKVTLIGLD
jgi:hypothetical protein